MPRVTSGEQCPELLERWWQHLKRASDDGGKPLEYDSTLPSRLAQQGFVNIKEKVIRLPLGEWPQDPYEKMLGRWWHVAFNDSIEPLCIGPYARVYRWDLPTIRDFVARVQRDCTLPGRPRIWHDL